MLILELPFPPSVNNYYRYVGHKVLISRRGRQYREQVRALVATKQVKPLSGPVCVLVTLFPPDRRKRDVDNYQKSLSDALQYAAVFDDDNQVVRLEIWKCAPVAGGKAVVYLWHQNEYNSWLMHIREAYKHLDLAIHDIGATAIEFARGDSNEQKKPVMSLDCEAHTLSTKH